MTVSRWQQTETEPVPSPTEPAPSPEPTPTPSPEPTPVEPTPSADPVAVCGVEGSPACVSSLDPSAVEFFGLSFVMIVFLLAAILGAQLGRR